MGVQQLIVEILNKQNIQSYDKVILISTVSSFISCIVIIFKMYINRIKFNKNFSKKAKLKDF